MNISELISNPQQLKDLFFEELTKPGKKDKELLDKLVDYIDEPEYVYRYAKDIVGGKVSDKLEDIITKSHYASFWYAFNVLKEPFEKGEETISKDGYWSYKYAQYVLGGPFVKGEEAILKSECKRDYMKFLYEKGLLDEFHKRHPEVKQK